MREEVQLVEIGKEDEPVVVEPVEDPFRKEDAPVEAPEPAQPVEPEKVPA